MSKLLQLRGGTTSQHNSFTGAVREVTVDTDKDTLVVHDGSTQGGFALPRTAAEVVALISNDSINSQHYAADSIDAEHYAPGSVDTTALAADSVTTAKIADNVALGGSPTTTTQSASDNTTKLATTAYVTAKVTALIDGAPGSLDTLNELALAINDDSNYNSTLTTALATKAPIASPTFTGNIGMPAGSIDHAFLAADCVDGDNIGNDVINSEHIAADSIDAEHLNANSVNTDAIIDGAIATAHFATGCVDGPALATNSVNSAELIDGAVDLSHMSDNSVDSRCYVDGSIDEAHIADDAVTTGKIASSNVTTAKIANDAVTNDKLSNSLGNLSGHGVSHIGLNAGDFIKWTDNTKQEFAVNGNIEMQLEADGDLHVDGDVIAFSTTISDATLKYDINPIDHALDKVAQLTGVTYKYLKDGMESAGLLAQDVEKVMPCAVTERKLPLHKNDGKSYKTLNYDNLHALLIESIKELTAKVEKLENK